MAQLLTLNHTESPLIRFARAVRSATEPDAIIATPDRDMVFIYYSRRHTIRGIMDQHLLNEERGRIFALCPHCPAYLAIPAAQIGGFPEMASRAPTRDFPELGALYQLRPDSQ